MRYQSRRGRELRSSCLRRQVCRRQSPRAKRRRNCRSTISDNRGRAAAWRCLAAVRRHWRTILVMMTPCERVPATTGDNNARRGECHRGQAKPQHGRSLFVGRVRMDQRFVRKTRRSSARESCARNPDSANQGREMNKPTGRDPWASKVSNDPVNEPIDQPARLATGLPAMRI